MTVSEKIHINLYISGNVQGVNFRRSVQFIAEGLGISGYAHNNPDGSVLIEAEGNPTDIQQLLEWCREGTSAASVNRLDLEYGSIQHYTGFEVR